MIPPPTITTRISGSRPVQRADPRPADAALRHRPLAIYGLVWLRIQPQCCTRPQLLVTDAPASTAVPTAPRNADRSWEGESSTLPKRTVTRVSRRALAGRFHGTAQQDLAHSILGHRCHSRRDQFRTIRGTSVRFAVRLLLFALGH